jgi:uncharacterized protein YndB with AHSA1/START domain/effector-binding domain-containing protein
MGKIEVERSILIDVPVERVFASVRDFKAWPKWSPWLCAEPDCALEFSDADDRYAWEGDIVGTGEMRVVKETELVSIEYDLVTSKPWKSTSRVLFLFRPEGDRTRVTWRLRGNSPLFLFWKHDAMEAAIGMDYRYGLAMLKDFLEKDTVPSQIEFLGPKDFKGFSFVGLCTNCRMLDVGEKIEVDLLKLDKWVKDQHITPAGKAFTIFHKWSFSTGDARYTIAYPVDKVPGWLPEGFVSGKIPNCQTYQIRHTGAYRHLGNAWAAGKARLRANEWKASRGTDPFEIYELEEPEVASDAEVTVVHFPISGTAKGKGN